jgi:hypothetical protein
MAQALSDPGLDAWLTPFLSAMRHTNPSYSSGFVGGGF